MNLNSLRRQIYALSVILCLTVLLLVTKYYFEEIGYRTPSHSPLAKADVAGSHKFAQQPPLKISVYQPNEKFDRKNDKRIFFHETNGYTFLNVRQTCAVESAAMHNPDRSVQLFLHTLHKPNPCSQWYRVLASYSNIEVILVDDAKYFADTPFNEWYFDGTNPKNKKHYADFIKMLTIIKGGGMSLDLDYMVLKPFPVKLFSNFFALEDAVNREVTYTAFHLDYGHEVTELLTRNMKKYYSKEPVSHSYGSAVVTTTLLAACGSTRKQRRINCPNLRLLDNAVFVPIESENIYMIFNYDLFTESILHKLNKTYALYTWSDLSHSLPVTFDMNQIYSFLAKIHCPITVSIADESA